MKVGITLFRTLSYSGLTLGLLLTTFSSSALGVNSGVSSKDTIAPVRSIELLSELNKNSYSLPKNLLVTLIDSLMELDTVPYAYYEFVSEKIKEHCGNISDEDEEELFPGHLYYDSWDTKNFIVKQDLLKEDTVICIQVLDSIHDTYTHPCPGPITSRFGWRENAMHNGMDIDLVWGDKVFNAFDGVVRIATYNHGYGNVVIVRHYNGLETIYAHLSRIKVKVGQYVPSGTVVGLGGSTGKSTGSHLHFEVRFKGMPINPSNLISFKEQELTCSGWTIIRKSKWSLFVYPKDAKFYTVKKGDTLYKIARMYGVTTSYLREINGMSKSSYLIVGHKLRVV